jgi:branched-chain amino acid transport system permease protein
MLRGHTNPRRRTTMSQSTQSAVLTASLPEDSIESASQVPVVQRFWPAIRVAWTVLVAVLALLLLDKVTPEGVNAGVLVQGLIAGSLTGMAAIGLVVVYRANRIINFAQAELGVVASVLAYNLMVTAHLPWLVASLFSIAAATALAGGMEFAVIRRLNRAPRLIVTVATIGLTQVLAFLAIFIAAIFDEYNYNTIQAAGMAFVTPLSHPAFRLGGSSFSYDEVLVLVLVPAIVVGLSLYFSRSLGGIAIRAAAQNGDRAGLLGVRVPRLSTKTWLIAGGLSSVAAILQAPVLGFSAFGAAAVGGSLGIFVRALAAAVVARMENMTVAFVAAVAIGVVERILFFNYARSSALEAGLLGLVLVALLLQRRKLSRASWLEASTWQSIRQARPVAASIASLSEVKVAQRMAVVVAVAIPLALCVLVGIDTVRLFSVMCIYAIVGLSLVLLSGWAGQVSLGQWAFAGVGAFVTGHLALRFGFDLVVTVVLAGLAGAFVALLVGLPAVRIRGLFLGATTLILATTCERWLFTLDRVRLSQRIQRPTVFGLWHATSERDFFLVCFGALILATVAMLQIRNSTLGRALLATRDNEAAAQAYGFDPNVIKLGSFAVAGFLAAAAGSLYAYLSQSVEATQYSAFQSLFLFSMVVIGGLGSIAGALIGAIYVQSAQYFLPEAGHRSWPAGSRHAAARRPEPALVCR